MQVHVASHDCLDGDMVRTIERADETEKPQVNQLLGVLMLAEWTGLEPATPGVTGRYSNQLNYHSLWLPPR